jgi:hypothetical protein
MFVCTYCHTDPRTWNKTCKINRPWPWPWPWPMMMGEKGLELFAPFPSLNVARLNIPWPWTWPWPWPLITENKSQRIERIDHYRDRDRNCDCNRDHDRDCDCDCDCDRDHDRDCDCDRDHDRVGLLVHWAWIHACADYDHKVVVFEFKFIFKKK